MERRGARVYIAEADVADQHAVQAVLDGLTAAGWPDVRGVFHAAGVVRGTWESDGDEVRVTWFREAGRAPRAAIGAEVARLSAILGRDLRAAVVLG